MTRENPRADHGAPPDPVAADSPFTPADDCYHAPPVSDPYWVETSWWSFNVPERQLGGWLHSTHHVNKNAVTWRVFAWDPRASDTSKLAYYRIAREKPMPAEPDLRDITFPAGGFSIKMLRPMLDYHVGYADREASFSIDIEHRGVHVPRRYTPGEPPAMFSPHFDQLGHVVGQLVLNGEKIPIDCYSIRDRTWGPRGGPHASSRKPAHLEGQRAVLHPGGARWREIERQRGRGRVQYIFGHAGAETGFLAFVRPQDGDAAGWSPLNVGWLLKDGEFERLDKTQSRMRVHRDPRTGWSAHMDVEVADLIGRSLTAEGFSVSHMSESGAGSNALMRWDFENGEIGWGEDQDIWRPRHFAEMLRALRATRTETKEL